jgi:[ribosomal protein S5]-alanine N-acetyltransferase
MLELPTLQTQRLIIRPFVMDDLADVHRILDVELGEKLLQSEKTRALKERAKWLRWSVLNYQQLAALNQPPYGDRAMVIQSSGELVGACGFAPCLYPFEQLPNPGSLKAPGKLGRYTSDIGLYYAVSPAQQRRGYASEAAQALIDYAFSQLNLKRIVATTTYENSASLRVMQKLGMTILKNPLPEPPWMQVVGILEYSAASFNPPG